MSSIVCNIGQLVAVGLICVHEYTIAVAVACARNINTIVLPLQIVLERKRTQNERPEHLP